MNEKFVKYLEEGRGRPKKDVSDKHVSDKPEKIAGKRGRPKSDDVDNSGKEGIRTVTLSAKIKLGKKTETATKVLKDFDVKNIDTEIKKYEKELHKKYKYDADDVIITHKIGDYEVEDKAEQHMYDNDGADVGDDSHGIGRRDK